MFGRWSGKSCHISILIIGFASIAFSTVVANPQTSYDVNRGSDVCTNRTNCHECIQTPECAWCDSPRFEEPRCFTPAQTIYETRSGVCPVEYICNPNNVVEMKRYNELTINSSSSANVSSSGFSGSSSNNFTGDTVQFSPQEVDLKLRIHRRFNVSFSYTRAEDVQVDVYFIASFKQPIEIANNSIIRLGESLAESMSHITSDYRIGFGQTFSTLSRNGSEEIFSFKHIASLSSDTTNFLNAVRNPTVTGNSETEIADANTIMQTVLSTDKVNWRPYARKLLLFAADGVFQSKSVEAAQQYATVFQVIDLVKQNKINVFWVAPEEQFQDYVVLQSVVPGSSVKKLSDNSAVVTDVIESSYAGISSPVEIKDTASRNLKMKYFSNCLEEGAVYETNKCSGSKAGSHVEFFAEIEATECPRNESLWNQQFVIYPVGVAEGLTINLELLCGCDI